MDTASQPSASFLYPLFEHMQREHGVTLVDSELEEIRHVCRQLETTAAEQAADLANDTDQQRRAPGINL